MLLEIPFYLFIGGLPICKIGETDTGLFFNLDFLFFYKCLQELLAYDKMFPSSSNLGQQTRIELADILLKDVYVTEDMYIERARILIWKARMTRTSGIEHLTECIDFLSEAISILVYVLVHSELIGH